MEKRKGKNLQISQSPKYKRKNSKKIIYPNKDRLETLFDKIKKHPTNNNCQRFVKIFRQAVQFET